MRRVMTNDELLDHLMKFSKSGPITQLVVLTAIQKYAEAVAKEPEGFMGQCSMIDEGAWRRACAELEHALENRGEYMIQEPDHDD